MKDHVFNIAEAKMHFSRLIDRVEHGDEVTISRNNRPVALLVPARSAASDVLARIDALRDRIRAGTNGKPIRAADESWHDFIESGRRH